MRRTTSTRPLLTSAVLLALALTGCGDDESAAVASEGATSPATEPATTTVDVEPTASPTETDTDFPEAVEAPEQGRTYGVVVLGDAADLTATQEAVAQYGFEAYTADIGCLRGAGPALAIADGTIVSYLTFADIDAAQDVYSLYTYLEPDAKILGAAAAAIYCLDG
ncbi:MAG: hypothetical protein JWN84_4495 [Nocardioides sp.]|nr:hypothetical protein [Nocardioides sp.]